jgi:parvulin-like peptidyl-prolyl isomerase
MSQISMSELANSPIFNPVLQAHSMVDIAGISISSEEVVSFLKKDMLLKEVCHKILRQQIVNRVAQEMGLTVSAEEVQEEGDRQRRELRLERAADTLNWLNNELITAEDWEEGIYDRLLTQKLKESLFEGEVERFFAQNRLDFDRVLLYQIIVPYEQIAQEVFYQIEEREISFYEAAHLYDINENRRHRCGFEGVLYRWSLKPEVAAVVFGANAGEVVRPVQTEQGFHLFMVEEFLSTQLTSEVRQEILSKMFKEWIDGELNYLLQA